jgi:ABC-type dipeptide/oligopeptide/nickel transport system permease component
MDYLSRTISLAGLSVPGFYVGILLMLLFGVHWKIFPVVGAGNPGDLGDVLRHLFLPALSLGLLMMAYVTRSARSAMLNVLQEDFLRTARAKGLAEVAVLSRHALRNALVPTISVVSVYVIVLIGSSVMTEIVFSRPGLGKLMVDATQRRDYTTIQSVMVVYAAIVAIVNAVVDVVYGFIDPRVRYD